jgi:hypothetical protein
MHGGKFCPKRGSSGVTCMTEMLKYVHSRDRQKLRGCELTHYVSRGMVLWRRGLTFDFVAIRNSWTGEYISPAQGKSSTENLCKFDGIFFSS